MWQDSISGIIARDSTDWQQDFVEALKERDLHVNEIAIRTNLPIGTINSALFMLEMNGVVISMAGGSYHLLS